MRAFSLLAVVLLLAGCANHSLQDLRQAVPEGSPYQNALARLYLDFAESEDKAGHEASAAYFADKGLQSVYGKDVLPEDPSKWNLKADTLLAMEKARSDMDAVLTAATIETQPQLAADTQFNFDCWVGLSERDPQGEETLRCRDKMAAALIKLHAPGAKKAIPTLPKKSAGFDPDAVRNPVPETEIVAEPAPKPAKKPTLVAPMVNRSEPFSPVGNEDTSKAVKSASDAADYIIFFGWNQWILTDAGEAVISEVVQSLAKETNYEVVLSGHTDRSGSDKYNLWLSKRRAEVVQHRLIELGIKPKRIKVFAYGESDPRITTEDGVREAGNRRVEIELQ